MGTTINPVIAGSPFDDEGPVEFPRTPNQYDIVRLLEAARNPKAILKAAEGTLNPPHSRPRKVTKPKAGKNLRASGSDKKKRGPFGEKYTPVKAASKGVRVAESRGRRRLRHSGRSSPLRKAR